MVARFPRGRSTRLVVGARVRWERSLPYAGMRRVRELSLDTHALAFGAQQLLCTAPLVVAVGAMFRQRPGHGIGVAIARFFGLSGRSADALTRLFGRTSSSIGFSALLLSLVLAVVFAAGVGAVQQRAFELIWALPTVRSVRSYLYQLAWVPALTAFTVAMLITGRFTTWLGSHSDFWGDVAMIAARIVLVTAFYWWSQRFLLQHRVPWRQLLPGAVAIGVLTTSTLEVAHLIMPDQVVWQLHAYGLIGVVFVVSVWMMALSMFIYAGALFGGLLAQRRVERELEQAAEQLQTTETLHPAEPVRGSLPVPVTVSAPTVR